MRPGRLPPRQLAVLDLLTRVPGASVQEVADGLGCDHSTAEYHLHRLGRAGHVRAVRAGRVRAHFASGAPYCPFLRVVLPQVREPRERALLRRLAEAGPASAAALAAEGGVPVGQVRWLLEKAEAAGLVEGAGYGRWRVRPGRGVCLTHLEAGTRCGAWGACAVSCEPPFKVGG